MTLEALTSVWPAVVANETGSNALVEKGANVFLATPRNAAEFLDKIQQLLNDTELRSRMGTEARSRAEQSDWSRVLAQIVSYYGEID